VTREFRRLPVALLATLAFGIALGIAAWLVAPFAGPDASGWVVTAMIVAAAAGFLAALLRLSAAAAMVGIALPALAASAAFLLAGGVLHGLGSGDPLKGPVFALSQFVHPGVFTVAALGVAAAAGFRMGTSPHRDTRDPPVG
jgi:MFS family permease